ncbi:hypothetical protein DI09_15p300 [Mitosporidium daphniae]|uniref:Uncharacterized protein n=1 Tax=Mitosporidium daphniae TaxID=1485682 RepID=A0A098VTV8_9MICR|nr:uncharacterized protein DI09_15p300 [Mitosporidium daphniae]KGG52563.1 hypothetical protein DI09_15p300 [Mitosporidium daphniae]|eukprot:XP_013238990.1 uncharacterized protein DI09_15p300 [Mitosporidium daphniae]
MKSARQLGQGSSQIENEENELLFGILPNSTTDNEETNTDLGAVKKKRKQTTVPATRAKLNEERWYATWKSAKLTAEGKPVPLSVILNEEKENNIERSQVEPEEFNLTFDQDNITDNFNANNDNTIPIAIPEWLEEREKTIRSILEDASSSNKAHQVEKTFEFQDDNLSDSEFDSVNF